MGYFDLYVAQIMRAGNWITLLSSPPAFSLECFRNSNLFEDIVKFIFWAFNESYRLQLIEHLSNLSDVELQRCQNLLNKNFIPYDDIGEDNPDDELVWCMVKGVNFFYVWEDVHRYFVLTPGWNFVWVAGWSFP